jgi:hypothetical protein
MNPFEVVSPTTYLLANGELHIAGVINHKGSTMRSRPEITVSLKDESGTELLSGIAGSVPLLLKPNSVVPYAIRFGNPPPKWAKVDVTVEAIEASEFELTLLYAEFETQQTAIEVPPKDDLSKPVRATGTIKNTGDKTAVTIDVSVILYYADGRVADVVSTKPNSSKLAPSEGSTFEVESLIATLENQPITRLEAIAASQQE